MPTYVIHESRIDVIGRLWQGCEAAYSYPLDANEVRMYATNSEGAITRDSVERYVALHTGDFASVTDFRASLWFEGRDYDFDFASEESELTFNDCMYGSEDD